MYSVPKLCFIQKNWILVVQLLKYVCVFQPFFISCPFLNLDEKLYSNLIRMISNCMMCVWVSFELNHFILFWGNILKTILCLFGFCTMWSSTFLMYLALEWMCNFEKRIFLFVAFRWAKKMYQLFHYRIVFLGDMDIVNRPDHEIDFLNKNLSYIDENYIRKN